MVTPSSEAELDAASSVDMGEIGYIFTLIAGKTLKYFEVTTQIMASIKVFWAWRIAFYYVLRIFDNIIQLDSGIIEKRKRIQDQPISCDQY